MADTDSSVEMDARKTRRKRRARTVRRTLSVFVVLATFVAILVGFLLRPGGIVMPEIMRAQLEAAMTRALPEGSAVTIDEARLQIMAPGHPVVRLKGVALSDVEGRDVAVLPESQFVLSTRALATAQIRPTQIEVERLTLTVDRDASGAFLLSFGAGQSLPPVQEIADLVHLIDELVATPPLAGIDQINLTELRLVVRDARAGRAFDFRDGAIVLTQTDTDFSARLSLDLRDEFGLSAPANAVLRLTSQKGSLAADLAALLTDVPVSVIAAQSPGLAWLNAIEASVSATLRGNTDIDGTLGSAAGTLVFGAGRLTLGDVPFKLEAAKAYVTFDPVRQRLLLQELNLASETLSLQATGHVDLIWPEEDVRGAAVGQFAVNNLRLNLPEVFATPVLFDRIDADLKLIPSEAQLKLGQVSLRRAENAIRMSGEIAVNEVGELGAEIDVHVDAITPQDAVSLWPLIAAPRSRDYLNRNLTQGVLRDVRAALRFAPGTPLRVGLTGAFDDASLKFLRDLPQVEAANGTFTIHDHRFVVHVDEGHLKEGRQSLHIGGSSFLVPDIRVRPGLGEVDLRLTSPLPALLSVLSRPPVNLGLAALPLDGRVTAQANIKFPMGRPVAPGEAEWRAQGQLLNLSSDALMPGRALRAAEVQFEATPENGLRVSGPINVDSVPVVIDLTRALSPGAPPGADIAGRLQLSASTLEALGLRIGGLNLSGEAPAEITVAIRPGAPADLTLTSNLDGLALSLPALGWSKPAAREGELSLRAILTPEITLPELELRAAGLDLAGSVSLGAGGTLREARFTTLRVRDWLSTSATLTGQGADAPADISLNGGRVDLRGLAQLGEGSSQARGAIAIEVERLQVSEGVFIGPFRGQLAPGRALDGRFEGRLNGLAPITGSLVGAVGAASTRLEVRSEDAGAALAALGVLRNGRGGALSLWLGPDPAGVRGAWDGEMRISNISVVDAPVLAGMLSALSIVGLLDQMATGGITFTDTIVDLNIAPAGLTLREGRSIGPSMGITYEGTVAPAQGVMDIQGVVSPLYLLNGIGGIFSARRGEGLFGFNYRLSGAMRQPQTTVNPLSILTPGFFREIFRSEPPELE